MLNVTVSNLHFSYVPGQEILGGIEMKVKAGDFVCLLGQSGCGKSTLLRLLAGLEKPDSGKLLVDGNPIAGASLDRSVVFQDYGLFPWMTAGENILIALKHKFPEMKKAERKELAMEWLHRVGLGDEIFDKLPKDISGGQKQRCGIARAFSIDPPILLMDEPFGSLDAVTKAKLQNLVLELWNTEGKKSRKTVFFVTHEVDEALLLATNIYVLSQSPASVMYHHQFDESNRPNRDNMYTKPEIMDLRAHLIRMIHEDAQERMKEEKEYESREEKKKDEK